LTHPLIQAVNAALGDITRAAHASFADPFLLFNPAGDTGATLCSLTSLCSNGDPHPSDMGYRMLADLLAEQLRTGQA
jgi:hypothetical protein